MTTIFPKNIFSVFVVVKYNTQKKILAYVSGLSILHYYRDVIKYHINLEHILLYAHRVQRYVLSTIYLLSNNSSIYEIKDNNDTFWSFKQLIPKYMHISVATGLRNLEPNQNS